MKLVVLEIKDGYVAVLSDDGCITKMKNNNYKIGEVIFIKKQKLNIKRKILVGVTSAAMFAMVSGVGAWAYMSPYAYVSLDVNPSIEFTVNRFDRVIDVNAVNGDGEDILAQIQTKTLDNQNIEDAIVQTINQISQEGYFDATAEEGALKKSSIDGGIVITTAGDNPEKAEELASELEETVSNEIKDSGDNIVVESESVGLERVKRAKELGITPGKLNLIEKLKVNSTNPDNIVIEDWTNKSVKDIMNRTKAEKTLNNTKTIDETTENTATLDSAVIVDTDTEVPKEKTVKQAKEKVAPQAKEKVAPQAKEKAAPQAKEKAAPQAKEKVAPQAKEKAAPQAKEKVAPQAKEKAKEKVEQAEQGNGQSKKGNR